MYIPSAFAENRPEVLAKFIRENSFGTLVTAHAEEGICASHLPFLLSEVDGRQTLVSHVARPNAQWKSLRPDSDVLVIFQGPHAYISPRWYEAKLAVPTWNYTAVHVYGRPRLIEDPEEVRKVLSETVATYEGTGEGSWRVSNLPPDYVEKLRKAIMAFAIDVTRMEGKFKLNQNRSSVDRRGVIAALEAAPDQESQAVAALMREELDEASGG